MKRNKVYLAIIAFALTAGVSIAAVTSIYHRHGLAKEARITMEQARQIALQRVP